MPASTPKSLATFRGPRIGSFPNPYIKTPKGGAAKIEKIEITDSLMTIDTRRFSFDMQQIENRRFMYQPETGELILGYQFHSKQLVSSHAEEYTASYSKAAFDSFIRGWIGTGKEYMDGVIHFAPNIPRESIEAFEKAFDTLEMFGANGAKEKTVVRGFGSVWEQPFNNLISFERSDRMSEQEKNYSSYAHDDLDPAKKMRIERTIYFESDKADVSTLTALPLAELLQLRQESEAAEQSIYAKLQEQAYAWEQQAGNTRFIEKAIEYVKTPEVSHTSNEWKDEQYDRHVISNRVYKMQYHIYENTRYDPVKKESVPHSWHLSWSVRTNNQDGYNQGKIAGQDRKVFTDKAAMEKYLNGRIKAYSHLFTELSPPLPQEYAEYFKVNGQLLPGYTIEGEQQPEQSPQDPQRSEQPQPQSEPHQQAEPEPTEAAAPVIADQETAAAAQPRTVVPIMFSSEKREDRIKEITEQLEKGVADVFGSGRYADYLSAMSKFHDYSFNNALLIAMQGGTLVRGFQQWKKDFDRYVKADEKAIKILAPAPYTVKKEVDKLDPETGEPVIGKDGKPEKETKEITIPNFKVVSVFDVSQTEGKELPSLAVDTLSANVEQYEDFFKAVKRSSPFEIGLEPLQGAKGVCRYAERSIAINEGMSELQTIKTGIHEVSHAKMHDIDLAANNGQECPDRRTREVQAESVAFMVCQHFGLDTSDYSFGYVAGWSSGKEMTELKSSLEVIQNTAKELIAEIEGHFAALQKQRENVQEQTQTQAPVFDTLAPEQQKALSHEVRATLETLIEADKKIYGEVSQGTLEAIAAQGYFLKDGQLEKRSEQPQQPEAAETPEKTTTPEQTAVPQQPIEEKPQSAVRYYPISETAARRANDANSYRDYRQGSATAEYRQYVDEAAAIAEKQKARVDPMYHDKIDGLLDTYARKLAENMNSRYAIDSRVPSILIAGGGNFPVRKKEKQNAARDRNHSEWQDIQGLLDKIRSTGMGGISADDPKAVEKLESKLHKLEAAQETMKAVNAYFRKHKTLDGCPHLSQENIEKLKSKMAQSWHLDKSRPFQSFALSNNNAEIRRVKERIADLSRREELTYVGWEFDGGKAEPNKADNRLQIFFDGKPSAEIREELKRGGFRWSPSAGAWQRQLNDNALYAADRIKSIAPLTGERIVEIQKHARQEAAVQPKQPGQEPQQSEIPAPDPTITVKEMQEYGYSWDGMLPLQQEAAQRLFTKDDVEIYRIYEDGTEGAVTSVADLQEHAEKGDLFGIEKNTWEALYEYNAMKEQLRESEPGKEALLLYGKEDGYGIYQLSRSEATRELRFEPYDRLQAAGHSVDQANYDLVYTAPLEKGMTLEGIFEKFNIDQPADFKGHSLSVSDIVVLHQKGENTAHYVDRVGYTHVPEFLQPQEALSPDKAMTGERVSTPRGSFHVTSLNEKQMRAAGYGVHHRSEDGQYLIMGNGTQAFAVAAQQQNPLRTIEDIVEQNDNMLDGIINNTPNTPTAADLEQKMKAGEPVNLSEYARAIQAEKKQAPQRQEKKPSILKQLDDYKKQAAQQQSRQRTKEKNNDLEV